MCMCQCICSCASRCSSASEVHVSLRKDQVCCRLHTRLCVVSASTCVYLLVRACMSFTYSCARVYRICSLNVRLNVNIQRVHTKCCALYKCMLLWLTAAPAAERCSLPHKSGTPHSVAHSPATLSKRCSAHTTDCIYVHILMSCDCCTSYHVTLQVGQYVGHTAPKTKDMIKKAFGGILLVDEAYYLYNASNDKDYGQVSMHHLFELI